MQQELASESIRHHPLLVCRGVNGLAVGEDTGSLAGIVQLYAAGEEADWVPSPRSVSGDDLEL